MNVLSQEKILKTDVLEVELQEAYFSYEEAFKKREILNKNKITSSGYETKSNFQVF